MRHMSEDDLKRIGSVAIIAFSVTYRDELDQIILQALLRHVAEHGVTAGKSWLEGWRYVTGNIGMGHDTWIAANAALL